MAGDYTREVISVRKEFWSLVQSRFAPTLALVSNRPLAEFCIPEPNEDSEDNLDWFSPFGLTDGYLSCQVESTVHISYDDNGFPTFISTKRQTVPGRLEAMGVSKGMRNVKAVAIYYGLVPHHVTLKEVKKNSELYSTESTLQVAEREMRDGRKKRTVRDVPKKANEIILCWYSQKRIWLW